MLVTAVVPEPRDAGKKVVLGGLLAWCRSQVGAENVHLVLVGSGEEDVSAVEATVHQVRRPGSRRQLRSILQRSVFRHRHTLQESVLYSPELRDRIGEILTSIGADLEIFDTVRMGQFAEEIPARPGTRRVVYLDDLFSVRYQRMLQVLQEHPEIDFDPLGDYRKHLPSYAARLAGFRPVQRGLLTWERRVVARRERELARRFDAALLVSPEEVQRLLALEPDATVRELPPAVAVDGFERHPRADRPVFVMVGLLTLAHNLDAAMVFLEECMPGVLEKMPDARVHIVGRGAPDLLHEAAARFGGAVSVDGYVPDLDALLADATALVMPLRFGSGIKIKVIEALAHGLPVVSTPIGAEGLLSGDGHGVVVEPDLALFGARMADLVDPSVNAEVSAAARRHYEQRYSEQAAFRSYDEAFA